MSQRQIAVLEFQKTRASPFETLAPPKKGSSFFSPAGVFIVLLVIIRATKSGIDHDSRAPGILQLRKKCF